MEPSFKGILTVCSKGSSPLNKMAAMPIIIIIIIIIIIMKSSLPEFRKRQDRTFVYITLGTQGLQRLFG